MTPRTLNHYIARRGPKLTFFQAIAALAIASGSSLGETTAAGAWVGAAVLVLSLTGLISWLTRRIPVPVVKGIQLGAGLTLVISAGTSLIGPLGWISPILDNRLWALAAFLALIATQRLARFPYALVVTLLGVIFALITLLIPLAPADDRRHRHGSLPAFSPWLPGLHLPSFLSGDAIGMALAQLPLTALNSIIAVSALAADLLPGLPAPSTTAMGLSVAAMNLLGCWFGSMPVCHGAGGLAAQVRFGAQSGASVVILGLVKLLLGLLLGESLVGLLGVFPGALLGVMVLAAGLELARVGSTLNHGAADLWEATVDGEREGGGGGEGAIRGLGVTVQKHRELSDQERSERWTVMLMTAAGELAFKNAAVGFLAGMLCHWAYRLADFVERKRASGGLGGERSPLLRRR